MDSEAHSPRTILEALMKGAAPERTDEIAQLIEDNAVVFEIGEDGAQPSLYAKGKSIRINDSMIWLTWLYSFISWRVIETYIPAIGWARATGQLVNDVLDDDDQLGPIEADFKARFSIASHSTSFDQLLATWPDDIKLPTNEISAFDSQEKSAFDLACFALASLLFHEMRHVIFTADGNRPENEAEEERQCDLFAKEMLTEKIGTYASEYGEDEQRVLNKRTFGLVIAAIVVIELTPHTERGGSKQYPSIGARLSTFFHGLDLPDDADCWVFLSALLTGLLRRDQRTVTFIPTTFKSYAEALISLLTPDVGGADDDRLFR